MNHVERSIVPRRSLRIELTPRALPFGLIGVSEAASGLWAGFHPALSLSMAFLVSVRVTVRLI
ncbi:hypothetical protein [Streptomyces asoensis]|uniref:Uncharacterized protein n=1 Tax=Streptomyces asoensis TaxID=249586 RepID=A0ABQ3S1D0_9ACTN|nr:hypothetical protein [Streptomyces asoensis]GGQ63133.1 hypothetical protein GCM10010496_28220 [Streptomyces asoensis]GHI61837.1 hypothetical protein Saso_34870 [Streptomyces asoensis]